MTANLREIINFENRNADRTQNTNMLNVWPCYIFVLKYDQAE